MPHRSGMLRVAKDTGRKFLTRLAQFRKCSKFNVLAVTAILAASPLSLQRSHMPNWKTVLVTSIIAIVAIALAKQIPQLKPYI